jgi:sulfur carrier protein ThiS
MHVYLRIHGFLRDLVPDEFQDSAKVHFFDETLSIQHLLRNILRLDAAEMTVLVNGKHLAFENLLRDGDEVSIIPPIAGG